MESRRGLTLCTDTVRFKTLPIPKKQDFVRAKGPKRSQVPKERDSLAVWSGTMCAWQHYTQSVSKDCSIINTFLTTSCAAFNRADLPANALTPHYATYYFQLRAKLEGTSRNFFIDDPFHACTSIFDVGPAMFQVRVRSELQTPKIFDQATVSTVNRAFYEPDIRYTTMNKSTQLWKIRRHTTLQYSQKQKCMCSRDLDLPSWQGAAVCASLSRSKWNPSP